MNRKDLERPEEVDFIMTDFGSGQLIDFKAYAEALKEYCDDLENLYDDLERDLDNIEEDNNELAQRLEEVRDVVNGYY